MTLFLLSDQKRLEDAIAFLRAQPVDGRHFVEIGPYKRTRTQAQNKFMWKLYGAIAEKTGHTAEQIHEEMKVRILGLRSRMVLGQVIIEPRSTTTLDVKEMAHFIEAIQALAREVGAYLPVQDDEGYITRGERLYAR